MQADQADCGGATEGAYEILAEEVADQAGEQQDDGEFDEDGPVPGQQHETEDQDQGVVDQVDEVGIGRQLCVDGRGVVHVAMGQSDKGDQEPDDEQGFEKGAEGDQEIHGGGSGPRV